MSRIQIQLDQKVQNHYYFGQQRFFIVAKVWESCKINYARPIDRTSVCRTDFYSFLSILMYTVKFTEWTLLVYQSDIISIRYPSQVHQTSVGHCSLFSSVLKMTFAVRSFRKYWCSLFCLFGMKLAKRTITVRSSVYLESMLIQSRPESGLRQKFHRISKLDFRLEIFRIEMTDEFELIQNYKHLVLRNRVTESWFVIF